MLTYYFTYTHGKLDLKFLIRQDKVIAFPNIILYGHNQLDLRIGTVQYMFYYTEENLLRINLSFGKSSFFRQIQ